MNILLTGFEPYKEFKINPSQQIAERLNGETIGGAQVVGLTLPVEFGKDTDKAFAAIADLTPALVISLGLAAGTACLEIERFAVNLRDVPAGGGAQEPIIADGYAALFATIHPEQVARAVRQKTGVPARAHSYAGAYLCNHIMYQALHYALTWDLDYRAGFIHLPLSTEQCIAENRLGQPGLPLEHMIAAVRAALEEALPTQ